MRTATAMTAVMIGLVVLDAAAGDVKPLTPVEAIKKVNEEVTVQMLVKTAKNRLEKRGEIYLDSEENFRDEKNLGIVITKTGAAKFMEAGVNDPADHFQDKIIRVKGTVIIKEQRPRIEVDDPKQIQIVKAPDAKDAKPKDPAKKVATARYPGQSTSSAVCQGEWCFQLCNHSNSPQPPVAGASSSRRSARCATS